MSQEETPKKLPPVSRPKIQTIHSPNNSDADLSEQIKQINKTKPKRHISPPSQLPKTPKSPTSPASPTRLKSPASATKRKISLSLSSSSSELEVIKGEAPKPTTNHSKVSQANKEPPKVTKSSSIMLQNAGLVKTPEKNKMGHDKSTCKGKVYSSKQIDEYIRPKVDLKDYKKKSKSPYFPTPMKPQTDGIVLTVLWKKINFGDNEKIDHNKKMIFLKEDMITFEKAKQDITVFYRLIKELKHFSSFFLIQYLKEEAGKKYEIKVSIDSMDVKKVMQVFSSKIDSKFMKKGDKGEFKCLTNENSETESDSVEPVKPNTTIIKDLDSPTSANTLPSKSNTILVYPRNTKDAISLTLADKNRLKPDQFLNDSVIDFFLRYCKEKYLESKQFYFCNTFFYKSLEKVSIRKWTRNVDIFSYDYIFIPINEDFHWKLAVVCLAGSHTKPKSESSDDSNSSKKKSRSSDDSYSPYPKKKSKSSDDDNLVSVQSSCILLFDSLRMETEDSLVFKQIRNYLNAEWQAKNKQETRQFTLHNCIGYIPEAPRQNNAIDCGVFVLQYVKQFCRDPPTQFYSKKIINTQIGKDWFPTSTISQLRTKIFDRITKLELNFKKEAQPNSPSDSNLLPDAESRDTLKQLKRPLEALKEEEQVSKKFKLELVDSPSLQ
uniref:Ubiquitin-like protease family profile domain-containing protein n=1 Tax=Arcella intermedia TaxID=1963864 RepID=A0A6B2KZ61_9EUKA